MLEKTLENPLDCKEIKPVNPKGNQSWIFIGRTDAETISNTLATWCEEMTHLKRPWCWERLRPGGEGDDRGWDGWMASPTQWTWFLVNSRSWWWTERPGVLQSMGSQRVRHNWATELNNFNIFFFYSVLRMKSLNFLSNWNPFKIWNLFFKKPIRRKCIIPEINRKTWFHLVKKSNRSLLLSKKVKSILET